jgi:homoserine kinase
MNAFRIFAPATIGNVASGFDVLGLAVAGLGDTFVFEESGHYSIAVEGRDAGLVPLEPEKNTVTIAAEALYLHLGITPKRFHVTLERTLPLAGGLGSSAASSVAGALAAAKLAGVLERQDLILKSALVAETIVAGPHLDNIAPCMFGGLTLVQDVEDLRVYPVPIRAKFWVTLATPPLHIQTKEARKVLPQQLETKRWTRQMAHCTTLALALALGDREQIAFGLRDPFAEPARGNLIPGFFQAKALAMHAGAYGFSISGSGPTCFALSPDEATALKVADAVQGVFGPQTLVHIAEPSLQGARIL